MAFESILKHPDYDVIVNGLNFHVKKGIFTPDPEIPYSSLMVIDYFPELKGKTVLDVGCGSGVLSIHAAKRGAKVTAIDCDVRAIENTKINCQANDVSVDVITSDLFNQVTGKYDYIFANLPINEERWSLDDTTSIVRRFLEEVSNYLVKDGSAYLTWLSIRPVEPIRELIRRQNLPFQELTAEKLDHTWYLFEITVN